MNQQRTGKKTASHRELVDDLRPIEPSWQAIEDCGREIDQAKHEDQSTSNGSWVGPRDVDQQ